MIVVDANVLLSAFRSSKGASHRLLREMLSGKVSFAVSPAVALEYEDLLKRPGILGEDPWLDHDEIGIVLDAVFSMAHLVSPWFRFRPFLPDPKDDMYIECAQTAGATTIATRDRHFQHPAVNIFGISVMEAGEFLSRVYSLEAVVMSTYPLRIADHVMEEARRAAAEDNVSLNQLLSAFIADGIGHRRAIMELKARATRGNAAAALAILDRTPGATLDIGDERLDESVSKARS